MRALLPGVNRSTRLFQFYITVFKLCAIIQAFALFELTEAKGYYARPQKRILLINSYHQGFEWTDCITAGLRAYLGEAKLAPYLKVENLDSKEHALPDIEPRLISLFKIKYSNQQPDVIICSDNNALQFLVSHRKKVFPGVPIVFCGINDFSKSLLHGYTDITGVVESPSYKETLELALKMHPKAKRAYIIACSAPTTKLHIKNFFESTLAAEGNVELIQLHDLTLAGFAGKLAGIHESDIIINLGLHRTSDGKTPTVADSYALIRKHTQAPVYNLWSVYLNNHSEYITGGVVVDGNTQGRLAGEMAVQILEGTKAENIPIITKSSNLTMLNYRELKRTGGNIKKIPDGAIVINRPFSFYQTYKTLVWGVSIIIIGMAGLIFLLTLNIRKRHRVESVLRKRETDLREREENFRVTLSSIGDAVIATNTQGHIQNINPVGEKLTGWMEADALQKPLSEVYSIVHIDSRLPAENPVETVLKKGDASSLLSKNTLLSKTGKEYKIAQSGSAIRNDMGEIIGVVLVFRDISEEMAMQEQLRQSHKMDAIGQLAGGIAHDFNNTLGGIISATELSILSLDENNDAAKYLDMVLSSAEKASSLTKKLLTFSRRQEVEMKPLDIKIPIDDAVALLSNTIDRRVRIHSDSIGDVGPVNGDTSLLQNTFLNLLLNSVQAMPDGGEIFISSRNKVLDEIYCLHSSFNITPGAFVEVIITDSGAGIPSENLSRVFEPFFTTKAPDEGTGLGLSAVFGTVQQHGGAISVKSKLGVGTSFSILLPISTQGIRQATPQKTERIKKGKGRILFIDDEEVVRNTANILLQRWGYEVLLSEDGMCGLRCFQKEKGHIDLIILDMIMPEMNGRDTFFALRKLDPSVPIIVSTGFLRKDALLELKMAGLTDFIHKPYRSLTLVKLINRVLSSSLKNENRHSI